MRQPPVLRNPNMRSQRSVSKGSSSSLGLSHGLGIFTHVFHDSEVPLQDEDGEEGGILPAM